MGIIVLLAVIARLVSLHRPIQVWLLNRKMANRDWTLGDHATSGYAPVKNGSVVQYYLENGFKAAEEQYENWKCVRTTKWWFDGSVMAQWDYEKKKGARKKTDPTWWWDVQDQTESSAPWMAEGITAEEWWERVRPK